MKKFVGLFFAVSCLSANAFSDPSIVTLVFTCPSATGSGSTTLVNFGTKIGGYGTEIIDTSPSSGAPYFMGTITGTVPADITTGGYTSSSTTFDFTAGAVTCNYTSATFSPISVSYSMVNTAGVQVASSTANTITLNQFVGLNA